MGAQKGSGAIAMDDISHLEGLKKAPGFSAARGSAELITSNAKFRHPSRIDEHVPSCTTSSTENHHSKAASGSDEQAEFQQCRLRSGQVDAIVTNAFTLIALATSDKG